MSGTSFTLFAFAISVFSTAVISATTVNFVNRCGNHVDVVRTENGQPPVLECALDPNYYCTDNFGGNGMNFKSGWSGQGIDLAEFTFNANGQDYYDLSVIVGFNVPLQIAPNTGSPTVTCLDPSCPDAFQNPGQTWKVHASPTGNIFNVTFCP